jgi:hypothetical protein
MGQNQSKDTEPVPSYRFQVTGWVLSLELETRNLELVPPPIITNLFHNSL